MYQFNNILVCLDMTSMDDILYNYTTLLSKCLDMKTIHLLHVVDNGGNESYKSQIEQKVSSQLSGMGNNINIVIDITKGKPTSEILKWSKKKDIDLVIMGRKKQGDEAIATGKVVNSSGCSVILIPEDPFTNIRKIVVAIDFTDYCALGLEKSIQIAHHFNAEIIGLHVYRVPSGYHTSGKSFEEYAGIMKGNAMKASKKFFEKHHFSQENIRMEYVLDDDKDPSDKLYQFAEKENADMISISSKGLKAFTDIFFDSTAEKLYERDNSIPLLVVKDKKENKGFLEAISDL